jgi:hypothetical protein
MKLTTGIIFISGGGAMWRTGGGQRNSDKLLTAEAECTALMGEEIAFQGVYITLIA